MVNWKWLAKEYIQTFTVSTWWHFRDAWTNNGSNLNRITYTRTSNFSVNWIYRRLLSFFFSIFLSPISISFTFTHVVNMTYFRYLRFYLLPLRVRTKLIFFLFWRTAQNEYQTSLFINCHAIIGFRVEKYDGAWHKQVQLRERHRHNRAQFEFDALSMIKHIGHLLCLTNYYSVKHNTEKYKTRHNNLNYLNHSNSLYYFDFVLFDFRCVLFYFFRQNFLRLIRIAESVSIEK